MKERILVPLGGSPESESVLPYLRRLCRLGTAEVTLFRTEMPAAIDPYTVVSDAVLVQTRRYLNEVKGRLSQVRAHVRALARIGPPAETILEVAHEKEATLILMSTGRRAPLSRLFFGSVAERVVQRSPIPVLVIPPAWSYDLAPLPTEIRPVENILIPVDGEPASLAVLPQAIEVARDLNSRLILLRVLPRRGDPRDCSAHEIFERAEEQLYKAGERCILAGVDFSVLIEQGDPAERILSACRDRRADWIAMATRGKGGLSRLLTGTVTRRILRSTRVPLLTVRTTAVPHPESTFAETARTGRRT